MTSEPTRDPRAFLDLANRETRGRLKIYLGLAPGVGKTYRMLHEARDAQASGLDVLIGVLETHGRAETERAADGLPRLPRVESEHKGVKLQELDVDGAIRRKPALLLVDELAHTNAPGSRNEKRWQDVRAILEAGIHVNATLNVQHVESLNDIVHEMTGVRVQETVPDRVLLSADEIVNVDLPVGDLVARLREGKVYPQDRVATALQNFFQPSKLAALRELALRETAKGVGAQAEKRDLERASPKPRERIMVCMSTNPPNSRRLLRKGARLAGQLNTDWVVVYVETPRDNVEKRAVHATQHLQDNLDLARGLGAQVERLEGEDVAAAILDYARAHRVGQIVIGQTRRPALQRLLRGDVVKRILEGAGSIDVHIVSFLAEPGD